MGLVGEVVPDDLVAPRSPLGGLRYMGVGAPRHEELNESAGRPAPALLALDLAAEAVVEEQVEGPVPGFRASAPVGGEKATLIGAAEDRQPAQVARSRDRAEPLPQPAAVQVDQVEAPRIVARHQHVADRQVPVEDAGVVHAAQRPSQVVQERREIDPRKLLALGAPAHGAQHVAQLHHVFQVAGDEQRRPVGAPRLGDQHRRGRRQAGGDEGAGDLPRPLGLAAAQPAQRAVLEAAVVEQLDHHLDAARAALETGAVEVVASPVDGLVGGRRVGEAAHQGRELRLRARRLETVHDLAAEIGEAERRGLHGSPHPRPLSRGERGARGRRRRGIPPPSGRGARGEASLTAAVMPSGRAWS